MIFHFGAVETVVIRHFGGKYLAHFGLAANGNSTGVVLRHSIGMHRHALHKACGVYVARVIAELPFADVQIGISIRLPRRDGIGGEAHAIFRVADFLETADFAAGVFNIIDGKVFHRLAEDENLLHRFARLQILLATDFQ